MKHINYQVSIKLGPIVKENSNGKAEVIGITSWGYGCAQDPFPGVYTNVAAFNNWIDDTIKSRFINVAFDDNDIL